MLVAAHQANYARICQLREESQKLDDQIKDAIRILADLRKELLAAPATKFPDSLVQIDYSDLLSYAKRISRFTVPPTYRPPAPWDIKAPKKKIDTVIDPDKPMVDRGSKSPMGNEAEQDGEASPLVETGQDQPGIGLRDLNEPIRDWLDPLAKLPFVPWPQDVSIRSGGLAMVQYLVETGKDPTTDLRREEHEAEERKKVQQEEDQRREKDVKERKQSSGIGANGHRPSRQDDVGDAFSLDLYDPDDM